MLSPQSADLFPKIGCKLGKFRALLLSSLLALYGIFYSFLLSESIRGSLVLPVLVLDSAWTWRTCEHVIHQEKPESPSRIWPVMANRTQTQLDSHAIFAAATLDPSVSSVLIPSGALWNFLFFSPFGKYLGGARFTSFSVRQCLNGKDLWTLHLHPSGTE